jgi:hypothetical protein
MSPRVLFLDRMLVFSADGKRLGRITHLDEDSFRVEEDRLFRPYREHEVYYREARVDGDVVRIDRETDQLGEAGD